MDCFIKKIFAGKTDDSAHSQFVRFGRGRYEGKAMISGHITGKIKVKGSFEYANDFVDFISEIGGVKFSGIILSREEIAGLEGRKKAGVYEYTVEDFPSERIKEIREKIYYSLLNTSDESKEIILKTKKKLPKPGKSGEGKVDDKFCQMELGMKYREHLIKSFFWDVINFKKVKIKHIYLIDDITLPSGEKDPEKLRVLAKRKGKIIRKIEVDGKEIEKDINFEA